MSMRRVRGRGMVVAASHPNVKLANIPREGMAKISGFMAKTTIDFLARNE